MGKTNRTSDKRLEHPGLQMNKYRRIPLNNAYNVRDLGGYPTRTNGVTRWGLVFRSDGLASLDEKDWDKILSLNIKTLIDLRSKTEAATAKINPPGTIKYVHFSLMKNLDDVPAIESLKNINLSTIKEFLGNKKIMESMKLDYSKTLYENVEGVVMVLDTILSGLEDGGSVLFFCSAGKDRTGIITSLLLYLCNVGREDIIADYMVSSTYNSNGINQKMASIPKELLMLVQDKKKFKALIESRPETIIKLLDEFEKRNVKKVLSEYGFNKSKQRLLIERLVE